MEHTKKFKEASASGDWTEKMRAQNKMAVFMKTSGYKPFESIKPALLQTPVFMSVFIAIRSMANLPVESWKNGGMLWFTNLTIGDPYYLLPIINALSLLVQMELGVEMMQASKMPPTQKWMMRVIPMIMLPFLCFQSSALCVYWTVSIWMAFLLKMGLKYEPARIFFKIPETRQMDPMAMMKSSGKDFSFKGMKQDMKRKWKGYKSNKLATSVEKQDETKWREAGIKGAVKTYKYDPTKVRRTA